MSKQRRLLSIASEWAVELGKFKGHELLVAEIAAWGFQEVDHGRHPDAVLKDMLAKIADGIAAADTPLKWPPPTLPN